MIVDINEPERRLQSNLSWTLPDRYPFPTTLADLMDADRATTEKHQLDRSTLKFFRVPGLFGDLSSAKSVRSQCCNAR